MSEPTIYCIDEDDTIVSVDDAWVRFGQDNNLLLSAVDVVGKPLWGFIADLQTRELYYSVLKRVRTKQAVMRLPFRCDGPCRRRYMELTIRQLGNGQVEFRGVTVREEDRTPADLFDADIPRSTADLKVCSWCKKLESSAGNWVEVEDAIRDLHLFEAHKLPELRHCNCPACVESIYAEIAALG